MQKMTPIDGQSMNVVDENIAVLKKAFPEAFTEDGIDFEVLRQLLGDEVAEGEEKYGLNWFGKKKARQIALTPSMGTLRPCPEESVDWDTTQNLFIEGDNLEVLKLLQKSYSGQVKLIYIDPPYNTGGEFIYPDKFKDNLETYLQYTGQKSGDGLKASSNTENSGRYHTNWLNMMYPRLKAARQLLSDEGIILISIDDNEFCRLKGLCESIFGEENYISTLIWNKQHSQQQGIFKRYHEYILVVAKRSEVIDGISGGQGIIEAGAIKKISRANPASEFTFPAGVKFEARDGVELFGEYGKSEKMTVMCGKLTCKNGYTVEPVTISAGWTQKRQMEKWFAGEETIDTRGQKVIEFFFNSAGKLKCRKQRDKITPPTLLPKYGMVSESTAFLARLMEAEVFPTPKPVDMIADFINWFTDENDIVMDFFAGSATTAHATMKQNSLDGKNRRFILVQLPEPLDINSAEQKESAVYCDNIGRPRTIAELSKERIRRSAEAIKSEYSESEFDLGFKVFKLDSSNIVAWNPDKSDLENTLMAHSEHLVPGRSEQDLLYELLLKRGVELTAPIEEKEIAGKKVYSIGFGVLFACLDKKIQRDQIEELAHGIIDWHKELDPISDTQVVFRDSAFENDVTKANMTAILEQNGIKHVRSL